MKFDEIKNGDNFIFIKGTAYKANKINPEGIFDGLRQVNKNTKVTITKMTVIDSFGGERKRIFFKVKDDNCWMKWGDFKTMCERI